jgi:hypothetical protein
MMLFGIFLTGCKEEVRVPSACQNLPIHLAEQKKAIEVLLTENGISHDDGRIQKIIADQDFLTKTCMEYVVDAGPQCVEFQHLAVMQSAKTALQSFLDVQRKMGENAPFQMATLGAVRDLLGRAIQGSKCFPGGGD